MNNKDKVRVAIQGISGAFHEIAARHYFEDREVQIIPSEDFRMLIDKGEDPNQTDFAIMAIENTIAGSLLPNYRLLKNSNLTVIGEVLLRIKHNLLANPGTDISNLKEVHSHPMAIAQCWEYFQDHRHIRLIESDDTAASARRVKESGNGHVGAIASTLAARQLGLNVLAEEIETNKRNYTRFLILERKGKHPYKDHHVKVSVSFALAHKVGSLSDVLHNLTNNNTNLTKIQSVPIIGKEWQYYFFIDFVINGSGNFRQIIDDLQRRTSELQILGTYEMGKYYDS